MNDYEINFGYTLEQIANLNELKLLSEQNWISSEQINVQINYALELSVGPKYSLLYPLFMFSSNLKLILGSTDDFYMI